MRGLPQRPIAVARLIAGQGAEEPRRRPGTEPAVGDQMFDVEHGALIESEIHRVASLGRTAETGPTAARRFGPVGERRSLVTDGW